MKKKSEYTTDIEEIDYLPESLSNILKTLKDNGLYDELNDDINDVLQNFSYLFEFTRSVSSRGLWILRVLHELEKSIHSLERRVENDEIYNGIKDIVKNMKRNIDVTHYLMTSSDEKTRYSVADIVRQALFNLLYRLEYHNIRIITNINIDDERDTIFSTDKTDFKILKRNRIILLSSLMTIMDNAIYWTRENNDRLISITLQRIDKQNMIIIADNGPGFSEDPEYLSKPFVTSVPEKIGLGLYFCKYMLELIGYKIMFPDEKDVTIFKSPNGEKINNAIVGIVL